MMSCESEIIIKDSPIHLAMTAADLFAMAAKNCAAQRGRFVVALSGGSTPRGMHRMLAEEPYLSCIPWNDAHIFWVDERCVPENDPASNYGIARKDFLDRVPIATRQIYPMYGGTLPEKGAAMYQAKLKAFFRVEEGSFPIFDLIFLGVGKDGHTASLFPEQRALDERERWVVAVKGGSPDVDRLTMTYPVLNHARQIVFLAAGKEKSGVLRAILEQRQMALPAQRIRPMSGKLTWLLDREAASLLFVSRGLEAAGKLWYEIMW